MFVYLLRHKRTGKEYVGKTVVSLRSRLYEHKARAKSGASYPLSEAIRQDGVEAFEMVLLAQATSHDELWALEQRFIEERNTIVPNGYNLVRGGRGNYGWQMPEATRRKIAVKRLGQPPWNKGRHATDAERLAMSQARKGKPKTPAQAAAFAKITTPAAIEKMRATRRAQGFLGNRATWSAVAKRVQASMSPEAKAERNRKVADAKREWWASRTSEQRTQHINKMKSGHLAA